MLAVYIHRELPICKYHDNPNLLGFTDRFASWGHAFGTLQGRLHSSTALMQHCYVCLHSLKATLELSKCCHCMFALACSLACLLWCWLVCLSGTCCESSVLCAAETAGGQRKGGSHSAAERTGEPLPLPLPHNLSCIQPACIPMCGPPVMKQLAFGSCLLALLHFCAYHSAALRQRPEARDQSA